eukprot:5771844-Prymnesium_polylepis.1
MSIGDIASGARRRRPIQSCLMARMCPRRRPCRARRFSTRSTSCVMSSNPMMTMVTLMTMMTPMMTMSRGWTPRTRMLGASSVPPGYHLGPACKRGRHRVPFASLQVVVAN